MNPRLPHELQEAPHLLVVGAGNSLDPDPARLDRRPSGGRCGGGGAIGGEIAPTAEEAARSVAHPVEDRRLLIKTLRRRGTRAAAASPLRRRAGLTGRSQTSDFICLLRIRPSSRGCGQGCYQASWRRSFSLPRGVWGQASASFAPHRDPHRQPDLGSRAT